MKGKNIKKQTLCFLEYLFWNLRSKLESTFLNFCFRTSHNRTKKNSLRQHIEKGNLRSGSGEQFCYFQTKCFVHDHVNDHGSYEVKINSQCVLLIVIVAAKTFSCRKKLFRNFWRQHSTSCGSEKMCQKSAIFLVEKSCFFQTFWLKNRFWGYLSKLSQLGVQKGVRNRSHILKSGSEAFLGRCGRFPAGYRPKSTILLMPKWHRQNSPEGLYADPKLGNCRIHPNPSQIAVDCNYLKCKLVWDDFSKKCKNVLFSYYSLYKR